MESATQYFLGSSDEEQKRLKIQSEIYGDKKYLIFSKKDIVCEIGCGSGANLDVVAQLGEGEYIGIDIQARQIEAAEKKARELNLKNTKFICKDAKEIPLETESVDVAFCRLVLIHLPLLTDPIPAWLSLLSEMYRITRVGGKIMVIDADVNVYETNKPYLNKCYQARCRYVYQPSKGTINICALLPSVFEKMGFGQVRVVKHDIKVSGQEPARLRAFYSNWWGMINSVKDDLVIQGIITEFDLKEAERETIEIKSTDFLKQTLWFFEGVKGKSGLLTIDPKQFVFS